ncbi:MAG: N-acetyl-gamma-glutamyl-phosphate reductase [Gemmatimonadota bacterium]|nr:N-acetyl-gamma-glutamyl-phosphate reductase [Gemmatimonadota bacterium]
MIRASILGGSGYGGGELLRLLLGHPEVDVAQVSSRRLSGKAVSRAHPNLRGQTSLRFSDPGDLEPCDVLFLALPHGHASAGWDAIQSLAPRIIDLSADFRLRDQERYQRHYGPHPRPDVVEKFTYGLAEVDREAVRRATHVATGGCNATVTLLGLLPLFAAGLADPTRTVVDVKVGSSEGGAESNPGSHHPVRSGIVRPYAATGHRHTAEVESVLSRYGPPVRVHMSVSAVDMVRGAAALSHVFLTEAMEAKEVWRVLRDHWNGHPFVRIVAERAGSHRLPEPRLLAGTNFCDVGFELDPFSNRLVVASAIDNLVKGSAGQAVQAMNLLMGWEETAGLGFAGLFPA